MHFIVQNIRQMWLCVNKFLKLGGVPPHKSIQCETSEIMIFEHFGYET